LAAVLLTGPDVDDSRAPVVRIFHPSFRDFLLQRCNHSRFAINPTQQQHALSVRCLQHLNVALKYDVCDIKDPTTPNSEVASPNLSIRLHKRVSLSVRYACKFWISHIVDSGVPDINLAALICEFASKHVLHWIELLSIMGQIPYAMTNLSNIIAWSKVRGFLLSFDCNPSIDQFVYTIEACSHDWSN
jgi:hypothetical protein